MEIKEIEKEIIKFRDERNWQQFHTLKDLLLGLKIECSELAELFLWKREAEIKAVPIEKIENELADIFIYLNYLSRYFNIDLEKALLEKIRINGEKYPVDKSFGVNKKYNELD